MINNVFYVQGGTYGGNGRGTPIQIKALKDAGVKTSRIFSDKGVLRRNPRKFRHQS